MLKAVFPEKDLDGKTGKDEFNFCFRRLITRGLITFCECETEKEAAENMLQNAIVARVMRNSGERFLMFCESFACGTPFWKALRVFKKEPMEERYRQFLLKIEKCGEVRYYLETTEQPNEILEMLSLLYQKKIRCIADYINQRMEGFSKVPNVLADRALKIGALSFLALFLGSYMGRQMDSASFIAWSVVMWLSGIGYAFHLLRCGEKKEYETIEGTVYEIKGKRIPGRVCKVGIRLSDGKQTVLLMDKKHQFTIGKKYRFYFNKRKQGVLFGIQKLDAALNVGSYYGAEEIE